MNVEAIKSNLMTISSSKLDIIRRIYDLGDDVITQNVQGLYKLLQPLKESDRRQIKTNRFIVTHEEVEDMVDVLYHAIQAYKDKYKVRVVPSHLNIFQMLEALNKIDAKQIVKEILLGQDEQPKKKTKQELKEEEKQRIKAEMKLKILQNK